MAVIFQKIIDRKKAKRAAHNQLTISKSTAGSNLTDKKENMQQIEITFAANYVHGRGGAVGDRESR